MVKAVVADEAHLKVFEETLSSSSSGAIREQVGLVVGKLSASSDRALVYSLLPTPPTNDGAPACSLRAAAPSTGKPKPKAGGKGGAGNVGISLGKALPKATARAFYLNLRRLALRILTVSELTKFAARLMYKRLMSYKHGNNIINYKTGVDHFCLHPGGTSVFEEVKRSMGLSNYDVEPARMTLHRWGNTSASSLWYVLSYMEAKGRLKRGERVLMVTFGAGFKCNSCVWEVGGDMTDKGAWADCIDEYPLRKTTNSYIDKYGWINDVQRKWHI